MTISSHRRPPFCPLAIGTHGRCKDELVFVANSFTFSCDGMKFTHEKINGFALLGNLIISDSNPLSFDVTHEFVISEVASINL